MAFGLHDIDSRVAEAFTDCMETISSPWRSEGASRVKNYREARQRLTRAITRQRWLGAGWRGFLPAAAAFGSIMVGAFLPGPAWLMSGFLTLGLLFSSVGAVHTHRRNLIPAFGRRLPPEVLIAAIPLMDLSPDERIYADTVAKLAALQDKIPDGKRSEILARLNELMASCRRLDTQREQLAAVIESNPVATLQARCDEFEDTIRRTDDPVTKQALQQSLQMCESRLSDSRTMEQNLQRVTAQQEVLRQTLASAQSALTRIETVPTLDSPAVEEISQTISQMNQQSAAVEEAVQEVVSL